MSISTQRGLPLLRQPFGVREARPDHEQACRSSSSCRSDGFEPSRPIGPVTNGRSSGSAARPSSALATPAPSSSATSTTSSAAFGRALADRGSRPSRPRSGSRPPARGRLPAAAMRGSENPIDEKTAPCVRGGDSCASSSCTSSGKMIVATPRSASAVRMPRSIRWRACAGCAHVLTKLRHVLEQRLAGRPPAGSARRASMRFCWPIEREHRLVVELRVVEPVQQVDRAGPRGGDAARRSRR